MTSTTRIPASEVMAGDTVPGHGEVLEVEKRGDHHVRLRFPPVDGGLASGYRLEFALSERVTVDLEDGQ